MTVIIIAAAGLLIYAVLCFVIAIKCLNMVVKPVCYDEKYMRDYETEHNFQAGLEAYDREWERHEFCIDRGDAVISGEYIINPADSGEKKHVAVICHGHTVNRIADLKYALMFYKLGWNAVIFDERHFGASTGAISTLGYFEADDLAEIIRYARGVFGDDCVLVLHGESMGAATALMVLDRECPDFVIADCPFADTQLLLKKMLRGMHLPVNTVSFIVKLLAKRRYGYELENASPVKAVRKADVPICLIHGDGDKLIPFEHSKMLFEACRNDKSEFHAFSGADHAWSVIREPERYESIVRDFINKCI